MGHDAQGNRRALIDHVKGCIAQVNAMTALATAVRVEHNTRVKHVDAEVRRLDSRCDAQIALIKANESAIERARVAMRQNAIVLTHEQAKVHALRFGLTQFTDGLSLLQRLRWILTGSLPIPAANDASADRAIEAIREADAAIAAADKTIVQAHASRVLTDVKAGRLMSAGMAPRPLP